MYKRPYLNRASILIFTTQHGQDKIHLNFPQSNTENARCFILWTHLWKNQLWVFADLLYCSSSIYWALLIQRNINNFWQENLGNIATCLGFPYFCWGLESNQRLLFTSYFLAIHNKTCVKDIFLSFPTCMSKSHTFYWPEVERFFLKKIWGTEIKKSGGMTLFLFWFFFSSPAIWR